MLLFVIPVRHPDSTDEWGTVTGLLEATVRSVCAQRGDAWRAVVAVEDGASLPALPTRVEVVRTRIPPPGRSAPAGPPAGSRWDPLRLDKGRRLLSGLLHARAGGFSHAMTVDADDFVSCRLAEFTAANAEAPGWYFERGYVHECGSHWMYRHPEFFELCGTSHVVRADLLRLPDAYEAADPEYVRRRIGSHKFIRALAAEEGAPLGPLPFVGAVYRVGTGTGTVSASGLRRLFYSRSVLRRQPIEFARRLGRLRRVSDAVRAEFGLPAAG